MTDFKEAIQNGLFSYIEHRLSRLIDAFADASIPLYLVGGSVRDLLLNSEIFHHETLDLDLSFTADFDFTTPAVPDVVETILGPIASKVWLVGKRFGTVSALVDGYQIEITTHRGDKYESESRKPRVVMPTSLEEDLVRRDFTINAIAVELTSANPVLIDPFDGVGDIGRKLLRTPSEAEKSFEDDPLRMVRAARFAAKLEFEVVPDVKMAMADLVDRLSIVSPERIRDELNKMLVAPRPSIGLRLLVETGLAALFLPELPLLKLEQDPIHHHKDVLEHTYSVVDNTECDLELRLAALFHDVGKPATRRIDSNGVSFHNHDKVGAKMTRRRMRELKYPQTQIDIVSQLVYLHLRFHTYQAGWTDRAVRRYVNEAGPLLDRLNALTLADCTTRNENKVIALSRRMAQLKTRIADLREREELESIRPELNGDEIMTILGMSPSKEVGKALDFLLNVRLDEGLLGRDEIIKRLQAWWEARSG